MKNIGAKIAVYWGDDWKEIVLTPRNWAKVKQGKPLSIRGKGYYYEAEFFWDYWHFSGRLNGKLVVEYGNDGAEGFTGN